MCGMRPYVYLTHDKQIMKCYNTLYSNLEHYIRRNDNDAWKVVNRERLLISIKQITALMDAINSFLES